MALAQLVYTSLIASPTPKFQISSATTPIPATTRWSACCWAQRTIPTSEAVGYLDLIAHTDTNQVIGLGLKLVAGNYFFNLGDLNTDNVGAQVIAQDRWYHYAVTVRPNAAGTCTAHGYLDGHREVGPVTLAPPDGVLPYFFQLWNSRASSSDAASVWVGRSAAFKVWDNVELGADEVLREMASFEAHRKSGLWSETPAFDLGSRAQMTGGSALAPWTMTGTFTSDGLDPPGVSRFDPLPARRRPARFFVNPNVAFVLAATSDQSAALALATVAPTPAALALAATSPQAFAGFATAAPPPGQTLVAAATSTQAFASALTSAAPGPASLALAATSTQSLASSVVVAAPAASTCALAATAGPAALAGALTTATPAPASAALAATSAQSLAQALATAAPAQASAALAATAGPQSLAQALTTTAPAPAALALASTAGPQSLTQALATAAPAAATAALAATSTQALAAGLAAAAAGAAALDLAATAGPATLAGALTTAAPAPASLALAATAGPQSLASSVAVAAPAPASLALASTSTQAFASALTTAAPAAFAAAINFRNTSGYVTDGAGQTYSLGEVYPTTRAGLTFGWGSAGDATNTRNRVTTNDPRLCGMIFASVAGGTVRTFRLDLPAPGTYDVRLALGDPSTGTFWAHAVVKDGSTPLLTIASTTTQTNGNSFFDAGYVAGDAAWSAATWPGSNRAVRLTFTGTVLNLSIGLAGFSGNDTVLAHLAVVSAGAVASTFTLTATAGPATGASSLATAAPAPASAALAATAGPQSFASSLTPVAPAPASLALAATSPGAFASSVVVAAPAPASLALAAAGAQAFASALAAAGPVPAVATLAATSTQALDSSLTPVAPAPASLALAATAGDLSFASAFVAEARAAHTGVTYLRSAVAAAGPLDPGLSAVASAGPLDPRFTTVALVAAAGLAIDPTRTVIHDA